MTHGRGIVYTYHKYMKSIFITKIAKKGTSLGVIIPTEILNAYNWQRGDVLIYGFAGGDQIYLKRLTDMDIERMKPNALPM